MNQGTLNFDAPPRFDGQTYDHQRDGSRLTGQLQRVFDYMKSGHWRTLEEISKACGGTEAACSARLRDLRKQRFGSHTVEREYVSDGLWRYRLALTPGATR